MPSAVSSPAGAPISVVIPTLEAAADLGPCLASLGEALIDGLIRELILADGGSSDGIEAVADALGARLIVTEPGRGRQLAAGAAAARGPWLLILHSDSVLSDGWSGAARAHMAGAPGRAGYFRLRFRSRHPMARVTAGWANLRARLFGLPYGDQGLLVARDVYDRAGGYPDIPLMEDVALARALRGRLAALDAVIETSAARYDRDGWLRRGAGNLWRLVRYLAGADPARLARGYGR